jgi:hypothetical protein
MNKNKGCIPEADKIYSKSELVDIAIEWSSYLGTTGKTSHWYEQFLEWLSRRDKKEETCLTSGLKVQDPVTYAKQLATKNKYFT